MGFIAGDAIDSISIRQKKEVSERTKEVLDQVNHSLKRIEENVKRGGEIVEGLLKYTRKGEEGFSEIDFNRLLDASIEMVQYKIKLKNLSIIRNISEDIPKINGNFTQLQEVFFNLIDNAYDAMMQRKYELKEKDYNAELEITATKKDNYVEILIQDNGMGVKKEDMQKLFTPFFTTKVKSQKGTGLGLYVIKQLVEENHHGTVRFGSTYKVGSQTMIVLPGI